MTVFNMSTEPSYVHSVHSAENRVDTPKPQDGWRFSTTMSNRPLRFAIVRTSDMIGSGRQSCLLNNEYEIRVDEWTYPHRSPVPSCEKSVSTRKTAEWTLWT